MTGSQQQPQPKDLSTGERLKTTLGAVAQGLRITVKGEHQTEGKAEFRGGAGRGGTDHRRLARGPTEGGPAAAGQVRPAE